MCSREVCSKKRNARADCRFQDNKIESYRLFVDILRLAVGPNFFNLFAGPIPFGNTKHLDWGCIIYY